MATIKEDFISFETAKLLKEKGFPQEYDDYHALVYNEEDYEDEYEVQRMVLETSTVKAGTLSSYPVGVPEPKCYCPTVQMAMKWLREVCGLIISIEFQAICPTWKWRIYIKASNKKHTDFQHYNKYEEACEAAIKYSLENLI